MRVITTDASGLAAVEDTRAGQQTIRHAALLVIPGNSSHVAARAAARGVPATRDGIARRSAARASDLT